LSGLYNHPDTLKFEKTNEGQYLELISTSRHCENNIPLPPDIFLTAIDVR